MDDPDERARPPERAARPPASFTAVTHALIRVNNVPFVPLRPPGADELAADLARLAELARWMRAHREPLCETLFQAIRRDPASRAMRPLLDLKRDIHGGRDTKVPAEIALALCSDDILREWYRARAETAALEARVEAGHPARLRAERLIVQQYLRHPDFLRATAVSSLDLQEAIDGYTATPVDEHDKRQRKSEPALVSYLLRAMTRTSPFSYYTSVALLRWDTDAAARDRAAGPSGWPEGAGADAPPPWPLAPARVREIEANHVVVRRIVQAAVVLPDIREQLRYRVCPDLEVTGDTITFTVLRDDPVNQPRAFRVRQLAGRVPANPTLVAVLRLLRGLGAAPYRDLIAAIAAARRTAGEAEVRPILERLIAAGILVPVIPLAENSTDIAADAAAFLRALPAAPAQQLAGALDELGALVRGVSTNDPRARRTTLVELQRSNARVHALAGIEIPRGAPVFYEDTAVPGTLRADGERWREVREDVAALGDLIELYDTNAVLPAMVRDTFVARHGAGGRCSYLDFIDAAPELYERWYQVALAKELTPELAERHPSLHARFELKRAISRQLSERWHGEEELEIGTDLLETVAAALPVRRRFDWASYGVFVQPEVEAGEIRRVFVNPVYQGLGMFFSRFLSLLGDDAIRTVRDNIRGFFPADYLVAGVRPVAGFNANLHPPITPLELDLELDGEPAGDLRLAELAFIHDPETDVVTLIHARTGQRVVVLYHGFLIPAILPPKWSLIQALASGNIYGPTLVLDSEEPRPDRPRICHRKVVLSRRSWRFPIEAVPRPEPGQTEARYFTRLSLWRLEHGLPRDVFFKLARDLAPPRTGEWVAPPGWTREKPQYLDFESAVVVRQFAKWVERQRAGRRLTLTETRPELSRSLFRSADGPHATELVIEINRPPGAPPGNHGGVP